MGPVVVDVNQTVSIRGRANDTDSPRTLLGLYWQFNNGSRIEPVVGKEKMSDHDVYVERDTGQSGTLFRRLHFKRIHPSSTGTLELDPTMAENWTSSGGEWQAVNSRIVSARLKLGDKAAQRGRREPVHNCECICPHSPGCTGGKR